MIHTARTRWLRPGSPSQEASERDRSASSGVRRDRFGTGFSKAAQRFNAGWSSPVARQAHNLKVIGSNPIPATRKSRQVKDLAAFLFLELLNRWRVNTVSTKAAAPDVGIWRPTSILGANNQRKCPLGGSVRRAGSTLVSFQRREHLRRGGAGPGTLFAGLFTAELQVQMAEDNRMTRSGLLTHPRVSSGAIPKLTVSLVRIPLAPPVGPSRLFSGQLVGN